MRKLSIFFLALLSSYSQPATVSAQPAGPEISYEVALNPTTPQTGQSLEAKITFTLTDGWHTNSHEPLDEFLIPTVLSFEESPAYAAPEITYPTHKLFTFAFSADEVAVYEAEFTITATFDLAEVPETITGSLRYQACNDTMCVAPKTIPVTIPLGAPAPGGEHDDLPEDDAATNDDSDPAQGSPMEWRELADQFTVAGIGGYASVNGFLEFLDRAESGEADTGGFAGKDWWVILLLITGGGLLLNLTPCVLPLIPINIAIIGAGAKAGSRARGFALGGVYGTGIAAVYGLLGLVVVLGVSTAFGSINATVWFNAGIAVLFVALGLAMFDVIQIDFSKYQAKVGVRKNEKGSFAIAFVMGCVSALLAGACVAPAVIYTVVYAQDLYSQGTKAALLLPFLLGAGMALPWPFAGAGLSFLPKPGRWMVRVKQAFGVFILLFAAWYGFEAYKLAGLGSEPVSHEAEGWVTDLEAGLQQAKAEDKPVLLDIWATWCKNCLVMDKTTLKDEAVLEKLDNYIKIKYQAENPDISPAKEIFDYYGIVGLPAYIVLQPNP